MVFTELKTKRNGNIVGSQMCDVGCDECKIHYELVYRYILDGKEKYNKDLCRSCKQRLQYNSGLREQQRQNLGKRNSSAKGKSFVEQYGEEKAKSISKKLSAKSSGKNNPNFGGEHSKWEGGIKWNTGRTLEEKIGNERAKALRKKYSENSSGKNNPMYGKPSPSGSGNGWSGWYKEIYFRSLLELSYLKHLIDSGVTFENAECSKHKILYSIDGVDRSYFPDFYLVDSKQYVEIKPSKLINSFANKAKFQKAKELHGENFVIITEKDIVKLSVGEIKNLRQNGEIKFLPRYEEKFREKYE